MTKQEVRSLELFDLSKTIAKDLFEKYSYPWEVLAELESFILELGKKLDPNEYNKAKKYSFFSISCTVSSEKVENVVNPPQSPVVKNRTNL